ncbi:alpha/beta fold hydrolase [Hoeflea poritis]|uniref:Alpha/beta hydrolase n=1 Tax=Hoeflea poritis TaxID=2993659 RepID=A0ABT4VSI9_9HYPH|nr:alpha/beta hydrolase [Hoeflea poritis]MDA4847649.1 alpha/beta hydrolase [Hoeflea poritis]
MIETSHAGIAVTQSAGEGPPVLMIHGNSSCKEVFRNQLDGQIGAAYRCIAMDLPGHGASQNAANPEKTYSMPGYAEAAIELMRELGHDRYAMLGWSLGGHIGLEMLTRTDAISGLMITGSPPVGRGEEQLSAGFLPSEHMGLAGQRDFSEAEIDAYARATCGINAPFEPFLREAVARTDGNAREMMLGSFVRGVGANQQEAAVNAAVPLAIVNGGAEPFVNNEFVAALTYRNLWEDRVHLMEGIGHAPFWEAPDAFDVYLKRFLESL